MKLSSTVLSASSSRFDWTDNATRYPSGRLFSSYVPIQPAHTHVPRQAWTKRHSTSSSGVDGGLALDGKGAEGTSSKGAGVDRRPKTFKRKKKKTPVVKLGELDSEPLLSPEASTLPGVDALHYRAQGELLG